MEDKIVGHKTFINDDGITFRHEPLTQSEAEAITTAINIAKEKRSRDMPTEQDAVNALWNAQERLKSLGWEDPSYAHSLKKDGVESFLIELGSSGIHIGSYHAVNGKDVWWIGPDRSPSHPCLIKRLSKD